MLERLRTARGVVRSLRTYYAARKRTALDDLYRQFVREGELVFDVGAHVGDRIAAFRRLGCRVVAVEPQPALARTLRLIYGRDRSIIIESVAVGAREGTVELMINIDNPTVSTASPAFVQAAAGARGWEGQAWAKTVTVPMTTLGALVARHGTPAFIKIDVEGFEAEVLAGLPEPVTALSFEFTTIQRDVAKTCIERCLVLGYRRFNAALGETQALLHRQWLDAGEITDWIDALPHDANSGDVYAVLD